MKDPSGNNWYIATHQAGAAGRHAPEGLRSITPYLHPRGADKLIDFLKQAFQAEESACCRSPDGAIVHAKIRIGDSILESEDEILRFAGLETYSSSQTFSSLLASASHP